MIKTCPKCKADLTIKDSVTRTYINKDTEEEGDVKAQGHYDKNGYFESDHSVDLSEGRYDLVDGSDTCTTCDTVLQ